MIKQALSYLAAIVVGSLAIAFGVWLAVTGRRPSTPLPVEPPPEPPPSLNPERDAVVAEVESMELDEAVDEMKDMGF